MKRIKLVAIAAAMVLMLGLVAPLATAAPSALPAGTFLFKWGTQGSANGQFVYPGGIAVDTSGNVY
ncbi:MAG: hypothetical protein Q7K03_05360, partial [Dehalococcoidia bacterium]|nr:hypothetical protein [Dehalococcoidia bacterium]